MSSSSSVSRQSAAKPGATIGQALDAGPGQPRHRVDGVGLQPGVAAELGLEGRVPALARPAEPLAHEPRGLLALAVVGVALLGIFHRHAVEGGDQRLGLEVELGQVLANRGGDGVDVGRARRSRAGPRGRRAASAAPSARGTPGRRRSPWWPRRTADRAAPAGCGRSPGPAGRRGAAPRRDCRSAWPSRRRCARPPAPRPSLSACSRVMVLSGPSLRSLFQILS